MEPSSLIFCTACSLPILRDWKGWPHRDVVPILPLVEDKKCSSCGQAETYPTLNNSSIAWVNVHGPSNTGLPDFWRLECIEGASRFSKWGQPYFAIEPCPKCSGKSVISKFKNEFRYNCQQCGEVVPSGYKL
jgi:ribosomal protein S27AE